MTLLFTTLILLRNVSFQKLSAVEIIPLILLMSFISCYAFDLIVQLGDNFQTKVKLPSGEVDSEVSLIVLQWKA